MLLILHLSLVSSVTCAALFWSLWGVSWLSFKKVYSLRLGERPLPYRTNSSQYICSKHHAHVIAFISLWLYICDYVTTVSPANLTISSVRARSMSVSFIKPKAFSRKCSLSICWMSYWIKEYDSAGWDSILRGRGCVSYSWGGIENNVGSPLERPDFSHLKCDVLFEVSSSKSKPSVTPLPRAPPNHQTPYSGQGSQSLL